VEQVFPQLVQTHQQSGLKTVGYMGLIPVMVEAIKAQQQQIDQLEAENKANNALEQKYEQLKQQYQQLEQRLKSVEQGQ
jgi:uncharacterized protein YceH (UPF0502 family)